MSDRPSDSYPEREEDHAGHQAQGGVLPPAGLDVREHVHPARDDARVEVALLNNGQSQQALDLAAGDGDRSSRGEARNDRH